MISLRYGAARWRRTASRRSAKRLALHSARRPEQLAAGRPQWDSIFPEGTVQLPRGEGTDCCLCRLQLFLRRRSAVVNRAKGRFLPLSAVRPQISSRQWPARWARRSTHGPMRIAPRVARVTKDSVRTSPLDVRGWTADRRTRLPCPGRVLCLTCRSTLEATTRRHRGSLIGRPRLDAQSKDMMVVSGRPRRMGHSVRPIRQGIYAAGTEGCNGKLRRFVHLT